MNNDVTNNNVELMNDMNAPTETQYVDEFGNPIDPSLIDENGNYIGETITQYVDEFGNPIDPSLIDENGNYIGNVESIVNEDNLKETLNMVSDANVDLNLVESAAAHQMDDKEMFNGMVTFDYNNVPITDIVNSIILDVINKGASDIHLDPFDDGIKIRIRIDGELNDYSIVPLYVKKNMITRIKIISGMNITESRVPQDGAIRTELQNKTIDLRVSCLPTNMGEKIVIRIMDYSMSAQGIESLDFEESNLEKVKKMLSLPNGIILVTGATGSGKSTTVYTMLQRLNVEGTNLVTVEDPIEMNIGGVNQVQAQAEIGLDFATVLRSILRQDPDVIMIGEIRDNETARIAVRASITGHLVLSTIHTNNSLSTIERLTDMEVERYLLGSSLSGIISQKLARRLCTKCRRLRPTNEYEKETFKKALDMDIEEIYEPVGCPECSRGYRGRIAIHEVLLINQTVRDAITNNVDKSILRHAVYASGDGTKTMLQDGLLKVLDGKTSFAEILKLIDLDDDLGSNTQLGLNEQLNAATMQNTNFTPQNITSTAPININITPDMLKGLNLGNLNVQDDDEDEEIIVKPIKRKKKKKIVEVDLDDLEEESEEIETPEEDIDLPEEKEIIDLPEEKEDIETVEDIELPEKKEDIELPEVKEEIEEKVEEIEIPEKKENNALSKLDKLIKKINRPQDKKGFNKTINKSLNDLKNLYKDDDKEKIDEFINELRNNKKVYKTTLSKINDLFPIEDNTIEELIEETNQDDHFDELIKDINSFKDQDIVLDDDIDFILTDDELKDTDDELEELGIIELTEDDDFDLVSGPLDDLYEANEGINNYEFNNYEVLDETSNYDTDEVI